jgi:ribonuclease J
MMGMNNDVLKIIPLGGAGEVNRNMYIYEFGEYQIAVDCGVGFPKEESLGVDVVIPDITYLEESKKLGKKLLGIILTHGHMDHIGGLPYILPRLPEVSVYGASLALALSKGKLEEYGIKNPLKVVDDKLKLGPFEMEFLHVTHSMPDCKHIVIRTPAGVVYHGADFKFDLTPLDNKPADLIGMARAGSHGIDLLLSDCLRVESPGMTPSEKTLLEAIENEVRRTKGRFVFTTMSSSISRMQMAINAAVKYGRRVILIGRSIEQNILAAEKLGFISIPKNSLVKSNRIRGIKPSNLCFITAGSLGQEGSAMHKIAAGEHRFVNVGKGDRVVISADAIPGYERSVSNLIDGLLLRGADVTYSKTSDNLHVSGHGHRQDLALLARLIKSNYLVPIGGDLKHMVAYRKLALEMGYSEDKIKILGGGQTLVMNHGKVTKGENVESKNVYVDGLGIGDVGKVVLQDRKTMAGDGMLIVAIPTKKGSHQVSGEIEIISRGFVYVKEAEDLMDEIKKQINKSLGGNIENWGTARKRVESDLEKFIYKITERSPLIISVVIEV